MIRWLLALRQDFKKDYDKPVGSLGSRFPSQQDSELQGNAFQKRRHASGPQISGKVEIGCPVMFPSPMNPKFCSACQQANMGPFHPKCLVQSVCFTFFLSFYTLHSRFSCLTRYREEAVLQNDMKLCRKEKSKRPRKDSDVCVVIIVRAYILST